jgi:hypothetical protein
MWRSVTSWLLVLLPSLSAVLSGQTQGANDCGDSLRLSVAFLEGKWQGRSYSITGRDTVLDALMKVHSRPLFGHCALVEDWTATNNGQALFTAKVVRAYNAPSRRWSVYYVDDQLNSQIYEGRRDAEHWRFFRTRVDKGGPVQVRLTWRPTKAGYEQLIERSRGGTWTLGGFVTFTADPEGGGPEALRHGQF